MMAFLAPLLLKLSPVGAFLKSIPPKVWYALAIIAALVGGYVWHQHEVHKAIAAAYAKGKSDEAAHVLAEAQAIKAKADKLNAAIAAAERKHNDEENNRIAAAGSAIRVLGPGKAVCPGGARLPAAAGGPVAASPERDAAGPPLPSDELAAVPWGWLTDRAEEHDQLRAEVQSWRSWYGKLVANWPKQP